MNYAHLWSKIRVQGGAYGCGSYVSRNGKFGFSSYRDPHPEDSLMVFENGYKIADSIPDSIENYIISAYAANTALVNLRRLAELADIGYINGITKEERSLFLQQILHTTTESLKELALKLKPVEGKYASCIIGPGMNPHA